nr:MAG TPA: hypothetical protein [Caudoviricetes sp.]
MDNLYKLIKRTLYQVMVLNLFNILYMIKPPKLYMYCKA